LNYLKENMPTSVFDIPIRSWDGLNMNMLDEYRGKVILVINVTADCGNAPQYGIIEEIYQKYKDQGFEVLAVPTNDYCGPGITYGKWEPGISNAAEAKSYAEDVYNVTYNFTELVTSNPSSQWSGKLKPGQSTHELYKFLTNRGDEPAYTMGGNFEKFLVGRDGQIFNIFPNYTLLDYARVNYMDGNKKAGGEVDQVLPMSSEESYARICAEIEKALAEPEPNK
jgi:glutathione peroxidase